jgi:hypothetical protein
MKCCTQAKLALPRGGTNVLVFRRVHVGAQLVGSEPELRFKADVSGGIFGIRRAGTRHRGAAVLSGELRERKGNQRSAL